MAVSSSSSGHPAAGGSALASFLPIILIVVVFYFLLIRPQQRRQKERNSLLKTLSQGDHVVTVGGLHGVVEQMDTSTVTLRTVGGTKLVFERSAVNSIREKGEVVEALAADTSVAGSDSTPPQS